MARARTRQNTTWGSETNHSPGASSRCWSCGNHIGTLTTPASAASQRVESKAALARVRANVPKSTSSQPSGSGSASYRAHEGDGCAGKSAVPMTITRPMAIFCSGDMAPA